MWHCLRGTSWLENYHSKTRTWTVQDQTSLLSFSHTLPLQHSLSITHSQRVGEKQKPKYYYSSAPKFQPLLLFSLLFPPNLYPKFFHFFFFYFLFFLLGKAKSVKDRELIILFYVIYIYIYINKFLKSEREFCTCSVWLLVSLYQVSKSQTLEK